MINDNIKFLKNEFVEKIIEVDNLNDVDIIKDVEIVNNNIKGEHGFLYITNKRIITLIGNDKSGYSVNYKNLGEIEEVVFTDKKFKMIDIDTRRYKFTLTDFEKFSYAYCFFTLIIYLIRGNMSDGFFGMAAVAVGLGAYLSILLTKDISSYNGKIIRSDGTVQRFRLTRKDSEAKTFLKRFRR